jgi:two-component system, NtrC family, sensor kinase
MNCDNPSTLSAAISSASCESACEVQVLQIRLKELEKENRILQKKLARAQINLTQIQTSRQQAEAMLKAGIRELQASRQVLEDRERELQDALTDVQSMQGQLLMSEKMSSLGVLVAGVAHEINNPVSFISGNLEYVESYTEMLLHLLELYDRHNSDRHPDIDAWCDEIDLDFVLKDFPRLIQSMKMGSDRIKEIVLSLRTFSRHDEAECKAVDIHDGLDSTLVILGHRLKAEGDRPSIEVVRNYGDISPVECYAGQLNQVFMNILGNAIDAIEESRHRLTTQLTPPRLITVTTRLVDQNWVQVSIADSGKGMPEKVRAHVFDPFFTTKPIGQGTGMGLSISYQIIVDKHHGRLDCFSEPGRGTEFVLTIPIWQTRPGKTSGCQQKHLENHLENQQEKLSADRLSVVN